jgi:hypothetical protein
MIEQASPTAPSRYKTKNPDAPYLPAHRESVPNRLQITFPHSHSMVNGLEFAL